MNDSDCIQNCPQDQRLRSELVRTIRALAAKGYCPGTGGNFSAVISNDPLTLLMSPSGVDKSQVTESQLIALDGECRILHSAPPPGESYKASAEAPLHIELIKQFKVGAVLHTHSVWNTLISLENWPRGGVEISGLEMLKTLRGVTTHEHREWVPIIENSQSMDKIIADLRQLYELGPALHGVLLKGHGLYTWGESLFEAQRHVEGLEFLFEILGRQKYGNS